MHVYEDLFLFLRCFLPQIIENNFIPTFVPNFDLSANAFNSDILFFGKVSRNIYGWWIQEKMLKGRQVSAVTKFYYDKPDCLNSDIYTIHVSTYFFLTYTMVLTT